MIESNRIYIFFPIRLLFNWPNQSNSIIRLNSIEFDWFGQSNNSIDFAWKNTFDYLDLSNSHELCLSEIMNYGNLLTTVKETKFLLRIQQNHIHLVEINKDIVEAYEMVQLMELPIDPKKKESLKEYLRRIPSTVKVSLLFCWPISSALTFV